MHTTKNYSDSARSFWRSVVIGIVACFCLLGRVAQSQITFRGDYETGITGTTAWSGLQAAANDRYIQTTNPCRQGNYAARVTVRPGDLLSSGGGERAEVLKDLGEREGDESWVGWSVYFGNDFKPDTTSVYPEWNVFTQWHHNGSSGQANVSFEVNSATRPMQLEIRTFGGAVNANKRVSKLTNLVRNTWIDIIFHVRWSPDAGGFIEAWVNCVKVVPKTMTPTLYAGQYVYAKQGFYRAACSDTSVLWLDGFIRSKDSASVFNEFCQPTDVELLNISASLVTEGILLDWNTATETNCARFEIERSEGNRSWMIVASILGHGTTTAPNAYRYLDRLDNTQMPDLLRYRLRIVDNDGRCTLSPVVEVHPPITANIILLHDPYPIPAMDCIMIPFFLPMAAVVDLALYSSTGEEVLRLIHNEFMTNGYHEFPGPIRALASGAYFVMIAANGLRDVRKVIVRH